MYCVPGLFCENNKPGGREATKPLFQLKEKLLHVQKQYNYSSKNLRGKGWSFLAAIGAATFGEVSITAGTWDLYLLTPRLIQPWEHKVQENSILISTSLEVTFCFQFTRIHVVDGGLGKLLLAQRTVSEQSISCLCLRAFWGWRCWWSTNQLATGWTGAREGISYNFFTTVLMLDWLIGLIVCCPVWPIWSVCWPQYGMKNGEV